MPEAGKVKVVGLAEAADMVEADTVEAYSMAEAAGVLFVGTDVADRRAVNYGWAGLGWRGVAAEH